MRVMRSGGGRRGVNALRSHWSVRSAPERREGVRYRRNGLLAINEWLSNLVPAREPRLYPALGDVSKGGKNGFPIHGRASYRRAYVVRRLLYPFNETQRVTMINRRAVSHPRQASLASLKIAIDPINARRNDMVIGFVVATASPTRPVVWCRSCGVGQVARTQKLPS
jgi:hypothetical protein